jgi:hypothetical protein
MLYFEHYDEIADTKHQVFKQEDGNYTIIYSEHFKSNDTWRIANTTKDYTLGAIELLFNIIKKGGQTKCVK